MNHSRKLTLSLAIIFTLLFQSVVQSYIIKCPAMAQTAVSSQSIPSSHAGHMDMSGEADDSTSAMSGKTHDQSHSHICPPSGCDICTADDCSQCAPCQLNAIDNKFEFWHKSQASISHALIVNFKSKNAFQTWWQPPTRAPPSIAI